MHMFVFVFHVFISFFPINYVLFVCLPVCLLKRKKTGHGVGVWGVERIWE